MRTRTSALALVAILASCVGTMHPVSFNGAPADWKSLAGKWRGEYSTRAYKRRGTIAFNITPSDEGATGEVLMISDRVGRPFSHPVPGASPPESATELLAIQFVSVSDGQIAGRLEPYWDPDRRCEASAIFHGSVDGSRISGTFTSRCLDDATRILDGRWTVHRTS